MNDSVEGIKGWVKGDLKKKVTMKDSRIMNLKKIKNMYFFIAVGNL